jgi:hypothetical protein
MPKDMICLLENVLLETLKKLNMLKDLQSAISSNPFNTQQLSDYNEGEDILPARIENKLFIIGPNHIWAPNEEMAMHVAEMIEQAC